MKPNPPAMHPNQKLQPIRYIMKKKSILGALRAILLGGGGSNYTSGGAGIDLVQVKLKRSTLAIDNKLFARLKVIVAGL
jgi:hypothetical protein